MLNIGMTYDLREEYLAAGYKEEDVAEFDSPRTIEGIEDALQTLGFKTERIGHVKNLAARLTAGETWDLVFNIAEGRHGFGREAQVPALLEAYDIPYTFSDPLTLSVTLHKGMAKHVVRDQGVPTPDFRMVERRRDIEAIDLPFPLFAKPVAEGTGKGIDGSSRITNPAQLTAVCLRLLERYRQPVMVEEYLPGREYTVGILGSGDEAKVLGIMEVILLDKAEAGAYSYLNKEFCDDRVLYRPVEEFTARKVGQVALDAWRALACRDGGRVDLRLDGNGVPHFMEVNPLAGLHPEHSDLPILCRMNQISYLELIEGIIRSAMERYGFTIPVMAASGSSGTGLQRVMGL